MANAPTKTKAPAETPADRMAAERAANDEAAAERAAAITAARKAGKPEPEREEAPKPSKEPKTYRAIERGYVDGRLIEADEVFTTSAPKGTWMDPIDGKQADLARAVEEGQQAKMDDVDLNALSESTIEALAVMKGINPRGLGKPNLIAAIRASYDRDRTQ